MDCILRFRSIQVKPISEKLPENVTAASGGNNPAQNRKADSSLPVALEAKNHLSRTTPYGVVSGIKKTPAEPAYASRLDVGRTAKNDDSRPASPHLATFQSMIRLYNERQQEVHSAANPRFAEKTPYMSLHRLGTHLQVRGYAVVSQPPTNEIGDLPLPSRQLEAFLQISPLGITKQRRAVVRPILAVPLGPTACSCRWLRHRQSSSCSWTCARRRFASALSDGVRPPI